MLLAEWLKKAKKDIKSADAVWLLSALLKCSRAQVFLQMHEYYLTPIQLKKLANWLKRRKKTEPLQYIVGSASFWGRDFAVAPGVLIPRPETEMLVELALQKGDELAGANGELRVLDLCSGSGAIGITLKLERKKWLVDASDVSARANSICRKNARILGADINVRKGNLLGPYSRKKFPFDLLVANPPYLDSHKDKVAKDVRRWEPHLALFPKEGTDEFMGRMLSEIFTLRAKENPLRPFWLLLELSPHLAARLEKKWQKHPVILSIERRADLSGRKRFLLVEFRHGQISY